MPFKGGPIGLYMDFPTDDLVTNRAAVEVTGEDGFLFVLGHVEAWIFVLSSSGKLGWVHEYDVGPSDIAGAVYHIDRRH